MTDELAGYKELLRQAGILKMRGLGALALGEDIAKARKSYLLAASLELAALAELDNPDSGTVTRHITEALFIVHKAVVDTEWLPELP